MKIPAIVVLASLGAAMAGPDPVVNIPYAAATPRLAAEQEDPAWETGGLIPSLGLSIGPEADGLTPPPTRIHLLWDEHFIYMRFVSTDDHIESPFEGHDQPHYQGDVVEVFLDSVGDGRRYVELQLSPGNQVFDQEISLDALPISDHLGRLTDEFVAKHFRQNVKWNMTGLRTATRRTTAGWIAEIAIPSTAFGLDQWLPGELRGNFLRYNWLNPLGSARRLVALNWAPVSYGCPHLSPKAMGTINLLPKR